MTDSNPAPKLDPETLVLRGKPRRIVRFRRHLIIGVAAIGLIGIAACGWLGLASSPGKTLDQRRDQLDSDQASPVRAEASQTVQALPETYSQMAAQRSAVPLLGPPLPGDLGKAVLEHRRAGATRSLEEADAEGGGASPAGTAEATARGSGVFIQRNQNGAGGEMDPDSTVGEASASISAPSVSSPSPLTLDLDKDQNNQARKLNFIGASSSDEVYNTHKLQAPQSPYEVLAGAVIPASLITGLNSDLPGMVIGQVTENVYDTVTGRILLIPQGTRLIGQYDSVVAFGQNRALLVWQRLILPDGSSLQIDNFPATDTAGFTGLADKVDYHSWALLKGVGMATLLGVSAMSGRGSDDSDLVRVFRASVNQNADQAGQKIVEKHLNVQPTIAIRPGWPVRVVVHKDLILKPYRDGA